MDQEVAKTLGELELKLQELERELTTIGHREGPTQSQQDSALPHAPSPDSRQPGSQPGSRQPGSHQSGRLVDEAVEQSASERTLAEGDGFGGPPVFGGEEVPSQAGATRERDWTVEARETAYGEIPTPPAPPTPGPPIPPPAPTPQPGPETPPGPPPAETPPGPPSPTTPPGTPPGPTQPGLGASLPPQRGSHLQSPYDLDPRQPAAVEESRSVDLAELVRFRERLASTMEALVEEYSRLLPVERPSRGRPGA